jgi:hypothetical protein
MAGMLSRMYSISLVVGVLIFLHAMSRPVALELMRKKPPKVLAKDGFIDDADQDDCELDSEEETLVFAMDTSMSVSSPGLKSRKKVDSIPGTCKRRRSNLIIPMAKEGGAGEEHMD